jgi:histidinol dehydrogenase
MMRMVSGGAARAEVQRLAGRGAVNLAVVEPAAAAIVDDVRRGGDAALLRYAGEFDGLASGEPFRVQPAEIQAAWEKTPEDFRAALQAAAVNIRRYCQWQKPKPWMRTMQPGLRVGQLVLPLDAVGCYVPGGRYPLPSTLLMTVIPAQVAGVRRIVVVSPRPARQTLAAAALLGVDEFYRIGGAQAVAALAYGTQSVDRVDKIVGPGNLYVTAAKKRVAFDCAIDFLAGPTEIVVVKDEGNPDFLAADLVAQAEHDPDATPIFVTSSPELGRAVVRAVERLSSDKPVARQSLAQNGVVLLASDRAEALAFANAIAPEHMTVDASALPEVRHGGSIFVGEYTPQTLGDYVSGPNHVLPTGAVARCRGGLSVLDFLKIVSVQESTRAGLRALAPIATTLAEAEGLRAHAEAVRIRSPRAKRMKSAGIHPSKPKPGSLASPRGADASS